jgi:hypothetical protein
LGKEGRIMGIANNDPNWRVRAGAANLVENTPVYLAAGLATKAVSGAVATCAVGIVPQAVSAGDMAPVVRQGKLGNIPDGFHAGDIVYLSATGTLVDAPGTGFTQRLGRVCEDDVNTMFIDIQEIQSIKST